jgi:trehalose/maltose hydrolase-like predicted phosphorylase
MTPRDPWQIVNTSPTPGALAQFASVCTVANGYLGLRGRACEDPDAAKPCTLLHGVYDELDLFGRLRLADTPRPWLDPRYFASAGRSPAVANLPDPLLVLTAVDDVVLSLARAGVEHFAQVLDLRTGVYRYTADFCDGLGRRTRIESERFASLLHPHRALMRYRVTPLNHRDTPIRILSGIDGTTVSNLTQERTYRVTELWANPPERCRLVAHTPARGHDVRVGVHHTLAGTDLAAPARGAIAHDRVATRYEFIAREGVTVTLDRCIALTCSEDLRHHCVAELDAELDAAATTGYDAARTAHSAALADLWELCDVELTGDDPAQLGLRAAIFHLVQAAPRHTDRLSVPVKLLTGEYYQGNTFYDTETHILPFYTLTQPDVARTCLNYRYESLRPAREMARDLGHRGAKFAWQAGPCGEECLGRWYRFSTTNIHINAAVAHALLHYIDATQDRRFLLERGVDILVETARFYASRAVQDIATEHYTFRDVAGPDESHCPSADNLYTNALARWHLQQAADLVADLAERDPSAFAALTRRLALGRTEPDEWRTVAERMLLRQDPDTGVYEQCAGFFALPEPPAALLDNRRTWYVPVHDYQAINQPDVLMAFVLLPDAFSPAEWRANYDYYTPRSLNFSSTSYAINALAALRVADHEAAYRNFILTTGLDLDEGLTGRHDTYAGLHGTAAGGAWLVAVHGFGGVRVTPERLHLDPQLPVQWESLRFRIQYRGAALHVAIDRAEITVTAVAGGRARLPLTICGTPVDLPPRGTLTHPLPQD